VLDNVNARVEPNPWEEEIHVHMYDVFVKAFCEISSHCEKSKGNWHLMVIQSDQLIAINWSLSMSKSTKIVSLK
jgi:hypothetical protein